MARSPKRSRYSSRKLFGREANGPGLLALDVRARCGSSWRGPLAAAAALSGIVCLLLVLIVPRGAPGGHTTTALRGGSPTIRGQALPEATSTSQGPRTDSTLYKDAFVLNYGAAVDRKHAINGSVRLDLFHKAARRAGMAATRVEEVDAAREWQALSDAGEITPEMADAIKGWVSAGKAGQGMNAVSCVLSHVRAWESIKDRPDEEVYLIFDDVAEVPQDFHAKLAAYMATAPSDWDILALSAPFYFWEYGAFKVTGEFMPGRQWVRPSKKDWGVATNEVGQAYAIRPSGARKLLSFQQHPLSRFEPLGDILRRNFDTVRAYILFAPLVKVEGRSPYCHIGLDRDTKFHWTYVPPMDFRPDTEPGPYSKASSAPYHKAYVINRRDDIDRLGAFNYFASKEGLEYEVSEAVDKNTMDLDQLVQDGEISKHVAKTMVARPDSRGQHACTLSHNRVWSQVAKASPEQIFLVFEDDSRINEGFLPKLTQALDHAPADWDFLYLNHNRLSGEVVGDGFWLRPHTRRAPRSTNALANAYLIRPAGARRMLAFQSPIDYEWSNDSNMRKHFADFNAYFLMERLVPQSGLSVRKGR